MDIKVISGHGSHTGDLRILPPNSYLIYITPISEATTSAQDDMLICVFKNWITLYKDICADCDYSLIQDELLKCEQSEVPDDVYKYKKILQKSIYYYLFRDQRIKLIKTLQRCYDIKLKKFTFYNSKDDKDIEQFNLKTLKEQYNEYENLKDILVENNRKNCYLIFLFDFITYFIKKFNKIFPDKHQISCLIPEKNKISNVIETIINFWENYGFDDIICPGEEYIDLAVSFLNTYPSKITDPEVHFFYGGVVNFNTYISKNPPYLILDKNLINKKNKDVTKDIDELTTRKIVKFYGADEIVHVNKLQFSVDKYESSSYFKNNLFAIIKETLKYDTTDLFSKLMININNPVNRENNVISYLDYKINDIINDNTIYIVSACRKCYGPYSWKYKPLPDDKKQQILTYFLNYQY